MTLFRRHRRRDIPPELFDGIVAIPGATAEWPHPRITLDLEPAHPDRIPDHVEGPYG